ncbi:saccharopine dehydrogenase [Microtetraspora sp. NBRC 13810]|uniref:saccharopine dehydrogenase family protein n=1 Tax=Microtetraspora sp. NBRC 13810 TaxID=3030990 RepID=UPI00249FE91F|nr:saccharopine dehydrogenase NADP-binding domain-containing protein [Microtetraspora sp. NBRC 13810]GLW11153.1 saccharopine dehydrogenase [Microtetraspora sp. NBRC 13810]
MPHDRPYDLVLFGATGFTGSLTAAYLARTYRETGLRWALAGRDMVKLAAVRRGLGTPEPALLHGDARDPASLAAVARAARVVATTVGPYLTHGEPLVAACAEAGTHYADLAGEIEFVDRVYLRHHDQAVRTGAKLVHACGFDSAPYDLGVHRTVHLLPEGVPLRVSGFARVSGRPSGGTMRSLVTAVSRTRQMAAAAAERRRNEPPLKDRSVRSGPGPLRLVGVRRPPGGRRPAHGWALPYPAPDVEIIARTARALGRYGPDFVYRHHLVVPNLPAAVAAVTGAASVAALAQIPVVRDLMLDRFRSGQGPSPERRARSWFQLTFVGEGGGERVVTRVAGGDPGYEEAAKILAESALSLAFDDLPPLAGQLTPATAMAGPLTARLTRAGLTFTTL